MKTLRKLLASLVTLAFIMPALAVAADNASANQGDKGFKQEIKEVAQDISTSIADAAITTKIKAAYALESNLHSMDIKVATKDGVVNLSGKVGAGLQKDRLVEIAREVKNVTSVKASDVEVTSSESYFKDAMITARAKVKIVQLYTDSKIASGYKVHVETTNGGIYLYGKVASKEDVKTIEKALSEISDVKVVYNNIKVKS